MNRRTDIHTDVAAYYGEKLSQYGETPQGVDWNGAESQTVRFEQLSRIIDTADAFSVNDVGCGYGALFDFLSARYSQFAYNGCDVSADMVHAARNRHAMSSNAKFLAEAEPGEIADYTFASGIFNVKLERGGEEWLSYIQSTLDDLNAFSRRGFAFNCLTSYSDAGKTKDYLYYADPCALFDYCKRRYSPNVALLHDYGLFEFTILVRKSL